MDACDLDAVVKVVRPTYSICTLVNSSDQYGSMKASFRDHGFVEADCEYIFADNSTGNRYDGFSGYNAFLTYARGKYIIICHQDVLLIDDGRAELDARLAELTAIDSFWAVCGNAGRDSRGRSVARITDPTKVDHKVGMFPSRVLGLDENFVVVRRTANLGVPPHLKGFHFYAKVLCAVALDLGMHCYVVDFHLHHAGGTLVTQSKKLRYDASYYAIRRAVEDWRSRLHAPRIIASTDRQSPIFASGISFINRPLNWLVRSRLRRLVYRWVERLRRD